MLLLYSLLTTVVRTAVLLNNNEATEAVSKVDNNAYVVLNQGKLQGEIETVHNKKWFGFYGIPYAAPPTGDDRWKAPKDAKSWSGTLHNKDPKKVPGCPQDSSHPTAPINQSEDCLTLNIYMPEANDISKSKETSRPVMFWIHGGSWVHGHGGTGLYNGRHLATQQGVIVVSINYRLGSFGFLYDENHTNDAVGNQAIRDMLKALDWVHANIAQFYGNPNDITIFGESAGGQSVGTLLSLKHSSDRNKFKKAIVQSSPFGMHYRTKSQSSDEADELLNELGCKSKGWSCAKSVDYNEIVAAQSTVRGIIDRDLLISVFEAWTPTLDNDLLDMHPFDAIQSGRSSEKDVIFGHTTGEGSVFIYSIFKSAVGKTLYGTAINALFGNDASKILAEFPSPCSTIDRKCDMRPQLSLIAGSYLFDCPMRKAISNRAKVSSNSNEGKTYYYLFDHPVQDLDGIPPEALEACGEVSCHGAELPYMFETFEDINISASTDEKALAAKLVAYWTQFSWTGSPNERNSNVQPNPSVTLNCWHNWSKDKTNTCNDASDKDPYQVAHLETGSFDNIVNPSEVFYRCDFWDGLDAYLKH